MVKLDQKQERWERAAKLAEEVLNECRVQLMLKFRFLDLALWRMPVEPVQIQARYALATDGKKVYFEPYAVLDRFEQSFDELIRDYLHLVMHCIYRHPFDETHDRADPWWLACDVIAESSALDLCRGRFDSELDNERRAALSELKLQCGTLTPGRLYNLFLNAWSAPEGKSFRGLSLAKMNEYAALFERDNHEAWPAFSKGAAQEEPGDVQELGTPDESSKDQAPDDPNKDMMVSNDQSKSADDQELQQRDSEDAATDSDEQAQGTSSQADDISDADSEDGDNLQADFQGRADDDSKDDEVKDEKSQEERDWEEIAKQVEVNLETFSKEWGDEAGALIMQLRIANRRKYDYSEFLRRFALLTEEMKVNDDEYDYIFYTYGLKLYGNMPLIEPLEYKETQRIRDFVVAIDTSESCQGDLIKRFLAHTFDILKSQEDFAHSVNIHIIQCDAKVQADTKITDMRDIDAFMDSFYVRGLGGTDFRPVFGYIQDLRKQGELCDMKGLIYFTDGLGTFPEAAPDYDTAFIFMDDGERQTPSVPPWAMKLVLDEEGINRFKSAGKV